MIPRNQLIQIAEEVGLLFPDSVEYNHPAHQRLISRLEKFAIRVEREVEEQKLDSLE